MAKKNVGAQTDFPASVPKRSSAKAQFFLTGGGSRNGDDETVGSTMRKKVHQGVNSPAYSHNNIITVKENTLKRNFKSRPPIGGSHRALKNEGRKVTPEVKGWKEAEGEIGDNFNKGRRVRGKAGAKGVFKGNPRLMEERMNALLNAANIEM